MLGAAAASYVIPNDGKFFYAVLTMGEIDNHVNDVNTMYLPVLISNTTVPSAPSFKLGLSTQQQGIEVFSSKCDHTHC